MLRDKQGVIKYHFLSLWYNSTYDWTLVSRILGDIYGNTYIIWFYLPIINIQEHIYQSLSM